MVIECDFTIILVLLWQIMKMYLWENYCDKSKVKKLDLMQQIADWKVFSLMIFKNKENIVDIIFLMST